ncbi:hypothetical protein [Marivita sp.]|uniref:hypothetical protein n=1 Tax=Marivita sp. TaxID=2003365 RepID=UPI003F7249C9
MNWASQLKEIIDFSAKAVWLVFSALVVALLVVHYWPALFVGLPNWTLPVIRLSAVLFGVLSFASVLPIAWGIAKGFFAVVAAPLRRRNTRQKLLALDFFEVVVLVKALEEQDRVLWVNADSGTIIGLEDKGLIKRRFFGVIRNDGSSSFEIPKDTWKILLASEEFQVEDRQAWQRLKNGDLSAQSISRALPKSHPAISAAMDDLQSESKGE